MSHLKWRKSGTVKHYCVQTHESLFTWCLQNHETLWSIYLKEMMTTRNPNSPVLRCLALRGTSPFITTFYLLWFSGNLPAGLRFALALLQSKIGYSTAQNHQLTQQLATMNLNNKNNNNNDLMEVEAAHPPERNELLHLLLSTGNTVCSLCVWLPFFLFDLNFLVDSQGNYSLLYWMWTWRNH